MRFTRFAPAMLLMLAFVFSVFPWVPDYSGAIYCKSFFEETRGASDPLIITLGVLVLVYPLAPFVGMILALAARPSRWRAAFVGICAFVPLVTLSAIYVHELLTDYYGPLELTAWFYLSHAATLVCVILCVREYKQASSRD
jgi:hypothetical protein